MRVKSAEHRKFKRNSVIPFRESAIFDYTKGRTANTSYSGQANKVIIHHNVKS